ncbi:MAG: cupin domain-containing protein [Acidobacteriota bacterium]
MFKEHHLLTDEELDVIFLYALGVLEEEQQSAFESHLQQGCSLCQNELRQFRKVTNHLGLSSPSQSPSERVKEALMRLIAQEPPVSSVRGLPAEAIVLQEPGILALQSNSMDWQELAGGAFQVKELFRDTANRYCTKLIRVRAGAQFPDHQHADVEEVFVLEGDLTVGSKVLHSGGYCRAEAGTVHRNVATQGGCLLLVRSSLLDHMKPSEK